MVMVRGSLPWTPGIAAPREYLPAQSFRLILKDLLKVLFLPMSLNLTAVEFLGRVAAGITLAILPLIAVQELGYASEDYALLLSVTSGISAIVGIFFGAVVDRYGAKRLLMIGILLNAGTAAAFASAQSLWSSDTFIVTILMISNLASQMVFVAVLAAYMSICWTKVAATQFSVYMSLANLARSVGAWIYGLMAAYITYVQAIWVIVGISLLAAFILLAFSQRSHEQRMSAIAAADAS